MLYEVITGKVEVLFAGMDSNWETFKGGESFDVPANSSFEIKVDEITEVFALEGHFQQVLFLKRKFVLDIFGHFWSGCGR